MKKSNGRDHYFRAISCPSFKNRILVAHYSPDDNTPDFLPRLRTSSRISMRIQLADLRGETQLDSCHRHV